MKLVFQVGVTLVSFHLKSSDRSRDDKTLESLPSGLGWKTLQIGLWCGFVTGALNKILKAGEFSIYIDDHFLYKA